MQNTDQTLGVVVKLERRAATLDNQGNGSEARVAPGRQGAFALACRNTGVLQQSTGINRTGTQSGVT